MDLILTGSRLEDGTSSSIDHRLGLTDTSRLTPVVYVVDPDEAERESLERLIRCEGWHAETFASAEEFLAHPLEVVPSCLLLDVSLPGLSGLELQKRAAGETPYIATIFLSAKGDIPIAVEAIKTGAVEFLTKPFHHSRLLGAFREALDRSRKIIAREAEKRALQRCYALLSCRQKQVMALVSAGLLNKQVGVELGISEITVKAHRGQVMQKMQANSFSDLIKMAAKLGLSRRRESPRPCRGDSVTDLSGVLSTLIAQAY
ncbi:response regulator transcription factor [Granulicella sp. S190]|uniref:response regulator transcription factor n=1 Tax=Granulicella sp. S190 TaxID=1747226 RepID=UPI00131CD8B0|nr:response regulator [Granulicella sp. S190]